MSYFILEGLLTMKGTEQNLLKIKYITSFVVAAVIILTREEKKNTLSMANQPDRKDLWRSTVRK